MPKAMVKKKFSMGTRSSEKLKGAHPRMKRVVLKALSYGVMDFSVIEVIRSDETQYEYFLDGKSECDGINKKSKHQVDENGFSHAVDLLPYPAVLNGVNVWNDKHRFTVLAGLMYAAASELNELLIWGNDWDSDGNNADSTFHDYPHWQLA